MQRRQILILAVCLLLLIGAVIAGYFVYTYSGGGDDDEYLERHPIKRDYDSILFEQIQIPENAKGIFVDGPQCKVVARRKTLQTIPFARENPYMPRSKRFEQNFDELKLAFVFIKHSLDNISYLPARLYPLYKVSRYTKAGKPVLAAHPESKWALVYFDETASVFIRRNVEMLELNEKEKKKLLDIVKEKELTPGKLEREISKKIPGIVSGKQRPFFHYNRGVFLRTVRLCELALQELGKAVRLRPDSEYFQNGYAAALFHINYLKKAGIENELRNLKGQAGIKPKTDVTRWPEKYREQYKILIAELEKSHDPERGLQVAGHKALLKECFDHMKEALRLNPGYFEAWKNMKIMYAQLGQYRKALECLEMYEKVKNIPKDPKNIERRQYEREKIQLLKAIRR
ncbi:MAG: hypothetical protein E3J72_18950 [Planctomycetota bacterium]|nr:MAG: hypothetical protein E3J72_18950 [Planctomycetota bacterium]